MSNQLEKLKNSIKKEYIKNFELNLMKSSGFIPVDKRHNDFYVILNKERSSNKEQIASIIKEKFNDLNPQFIPIAGSDFEEIFKTLNVTEPEAEQNKSNAEPTAEEMLVGIGWITQDQLKECLNISKEKNIPLDAVFFEKEYLSYERIVSYLKKKYGCEVISKENINVDKKILKLLPDDFIEKKQTIIMSMEGNNLAVAMVNPTDKYTIREISLSNGRALNVYCIPYFEYDMYLKDYFMQKNTI